MAAFVSPAPTLTVTVFLNDCSVLTKRTVCEPALTEYLSFGVLPMGLPSRTIEDAGIELMLRNASPPDGAVSPPPELDVVFAGGYCGRAAGRGGAGAGGW